MSDPGKLFLIKIEVGDARTEESFSYECDTLDQALDYARSKVLMYGARARVSCVRELTTEEME